MLFSLGKIAGLTYGIALYFAVVAATAVSWRRFAVGLIIYFGAGTGITGLALLSMQPSSKLPLLRNIVALLPSKIINLPGAGDYVNANQAAGVLLWLVPIAIVVVWGLWRYFAQLRRQVRLFPAIVILLAATAVSLFLIAVLLIAQSRGALLGFGMGLLLILAVALRRWKWWLLGAVAIAVLASGILISRVGSEQLTGLSFEQVDIQYDNVLNMLDGRLEIWSRALYGIQDFPFTGMGMNNFRRVVHILYPLFLIAPDTDIAHAHNHLLQTALDLGLPGLIAYLAIWLGAAVMLWQTWRNATHDMSKILAVGFAASLLAYFVYGLMDTVALGAKPGFIFWMMWGLITALYHLTCHPQRPLY
jgi:putative inorganic carbon (HCO3(-)) transporter